MGVEHGEGPILISAGPGTGKTHTLVRRIAYLAEKRGVFPEKILAVTFTNRAASEMKDRLANLLPGVDHLPYAATFHSFCLDVLEKFCRLQDDEKNFSIIDDYERKLIVSDAIMMSGERGRDHFSEANLFVDRIVYAKQNLLSPEDDLQEAAGGIEAAEFALVYRIYRDILSSQSLYDYEDLVFETNRLFDKNSNFKELYKKKFEYIFVDECQDLNFGQYKLIRALAPPDKSIFLIGDPDQSIYGFRGSDVKYLRKFLQDYPKTKSIKLLQNYRSAETILDASFQIIERGRFYSSAPKIYSKIGGSTTIGIIETETEKAEAEAVVVAIERMTGGTGFFSFDSKRVESSYALRNRGFSDFAVLFRTASQGDVIKKAFDRSGMPCQLLSKKDLFFKKEMASLVSLFKITNECGAVSDIERIFKKVKSGIGAKTAKAFKKWAYKKGFTLSRAMKSAELFPVPGIDIPAQRKLIAFFERIESIKKQKINDGGNRESIESQLDCLAKFLRIDHDLANDPEAEEAFKRIMGIAAKHKFSTSGFLRNLALKTDPDSFAPEAEKVSLMTMHASKGLEFPVVFITGCENGIIPFKRDDRNFDQDAELKTSNESTAESDEERRLFYVAMTRAKEELYLSYAKRRTIYGKTKIGKLSPFVSLIEKRLRRRIDVFEGKGKKPGQLQYKLF